MKKYSFILCIALVAFVVASCGLKGNHTSSGRAYELLVVNISSLQLIPVNIIAYRSQYGSANPAAIVGPAIIATTISTLVGVIWCKIKCKGRIRNN